MQCQICQESSATIHLTEIVDGTRSEMHICERCAQEQGITIKSQMPLNELLSNLLSSAPADDELADPAEKDSSCSHCGFTLDQFRKDGVLGCPQDYEVFEESLLPLIKNAHDGKASHCGKIPSKMPKDSQKQVELADMRRQLEVAVQAEDYERAAKLRDRISEIE